MSTLKVDGIRSNSATSDAITLADNGTCTANITNNLSNRNKIINGSMVINQRGGGGTGVTTTGYKPAPDRFEFNISSMGTWTVGQSGSYPEGFNHSYYMTCTTQDTSPAASDFVSLSTKLEGYDVQDFLKGTSNAKEFSLSFWVRSESHTGTMIAELYDNDNARSCSKSYTINATQTWEHKTITFPADTTGAFGRDNGTSLILVLWMGGGSNYTSGSLATTWGSATSANRAVGQTNMAQNGASIRFTGIQLEVGSTATDFEHRSFGQELALCQRYYQVVRASLRNDYRTDLVATFGSGIQLYCEMRATPTATTVTSVATQDVSNVSYGYISNKGFIIVATGIVTTGGQAAQQAVRDVGLAAEL